MKRIFSLLILAVALLVGSGNTAAQTVADQKLGELLNEGDLFQLREQYSQLRDSVSLEMLRLMAEAQTGIGFNRLDRAASALDSLLQSHQEALGVQNSVGLAALRAMNLLNLGLYAEAGEAGGDLVEALKGQLSFESLYSFLFIQRVGEALADTPKPYLERPDHDVEVAMKCDKVGRGHHLYLPVEVNGVTRDFIFDTGCSFGNFVSEEYAREAGLTIVADSVPVSGMTVGFVKLATAKELKIGELTYHNPVFMVAPRDEEVDSVFAFDGVLGYHFIRDAREVVIDNERGVCRFPVKISEGEPNMYLSSNTPQVRIDYGGRALDLVFDTGNVKTDLGKGFAECFPEAVAGLKVQDARRGGFGGMQSVKAVVLPEFRFSVGGRTVALRDTEVIMDASGNSQLFSGSLGADFVLAFKRLTINYEHMFVRGE